jgi:hypothetical protein
MNMGEVIGFIVILLGGAMLAWLMILGMIGAYRFVVGRNEAERRELEAKKRIAELMRKAGGKKRPPPR